MSLPNEQNDGWHCGGWEGARRETYRMMQEMTFDQKLDWLEGAQELIAEIHGPEAALLPSGSTVMPRWYKQNDKAYCRSEKPGSQPRQGRQSLARGVSPGEKRHSPEAPAGA